MRKFGLLVVILIVGGLAWTALWFLAAGRADSAVADWIAHEATQGRQWTCDQRRVGGYPFALAVRCDAPAYSGQALDQRVVAKLAGLTATLSLRHPHELRLRLDAPFSFRSSDGRTDVAARWTDLDLTLAPLTDVRTLTLHGTALVLSGQSVAQGMGTASAVDVAVGFSQPQADPTLDFAIAVKGTPVPPLDDLLGGSDMADIALAGRLDRTDAADARTPEEAMEHWRVAGGHVDLDHSLLTRATASAAASGTLRLDDQHRLAGRLDAEFLGLQPVFARYGLGGNVTAVTSLLGAIFGGGKPRKAPSAPGALDLPISFQGGRLGVGPITTDVRLTPLY